MNIDTGSSLLDDSIEDMAVAAESVSFVAEPNKLTIKSDGHMHSARVELNEGEGTNIKIKGDKSITAKYSLDYLKKITKGSKLASNVVVKFGEDYPLKIEYNVLDKLSLSVILAPRVSNE